MTASLRGLALCTALLVVLGLGWVLGLGAPGAPPSPQLWARRPESVQSIRWLHGGQARLTAQRDGAGWTATPAASGRAWPADARVIDDVLDVLAAARWHRRDVVARAGAVTDQVILHGGRREVSIGLGAALGEQRWLVLDGRALLVDGWVARVLERAPDQLLDLALLPGAARAPVVEIHRSGAAPWRSSALVLQGASRVSPSRARLDEELGRALRDQLAALQLEPALSARGDDAPAGDSAAGAAPLWSVRVAGGPRGEATLAGLDAGAGACAGGARVSSSRLGAGCLRDAALRPLAELIDRAASAAGVEARPLAAAPRDIEEWTVTGPPTGGGGGAVGGPGRGWPLAPDRLRLVRQGAAGWIGERGGAPFSVEPEAAEELLALLCSPWSIASAAARPPAPGALSLTARHRDGTTVSLSLSSSSSDGGGALVAVREGEPFSLTSPVPRSLSPASLAASLASLSLWQLEPTSVARVALGAEALRRGAVIGEWLDARGQPIAAARAAALEELLSQLASLRALSRSGPAGFSGASAPARYRLSLWLDEAPSRTSSQGGSGEAPAAHTLALSLIRGECAGRADGEGGVFSPELCAQLAALVR